MKLWIIGRFTFFYPKRIFLLLARLSLFAVSILADSTHKQLENAKCVESYFNRSIEIIDYKFFIF